MVWLVRNGTACECVMPPCVSSLHRIWCIQNCFPCACHDNGMQDMRVKQRLYRIQNIYMVRHLWKVMRFRFLIDNICLLMTYQNVYWCVFPNKCSSQELHMWYTKFWRYDIYLGSVLFLWLHFRLYFHDLTFRNQNILWIFSAVFLRHCRNPKHQRTLDVHRHYVLWWFLAT